MRAIKLSVFFLVCIGLGLGMSGCVSERQKELELANRRQSDLIDELRADLNAANLELDALRRKLDDAEALGGIGAKELRDQIKLLEDEIKRKDAMIADMQQQLLGAPVLPPELSTLLEDFAKEYDLVEYDSARGIVKLKSETWWSMILLVV
jgi:predicted  nucleic acid-binding Zn-ribbon protein